MIKNTLIFLSCFLTGCGVSIENYKQTQPEFDLKKFFNGKMVAYGLFKDYSGQVVRRFTIKMEGIWDGDKGTLKEDFIYDDGEKQHRTWHLTDLGNGQFSGSADDVVGDAQGQSAGFATRWQYTVALPYQGSVLHVGFDDWMYMVDENRVLNHAKVTKWSFKVGEVVLYLEKVDTDG